MIKKDKNSADGKTADAAMHGRSEQRDEEIGAEEKVLEQVAPEMENESPLRPRSITVEENSGEKSLKSSCEDVIRPEKL